MRYRFEKYCKDYKNIENYEKAKADNFKNWEIHHRLQTWTSDGERRLVDITADELISADIYYNRPADELIFMTASEHSRLHTKGKKLSEETKKKIGEASKGRHHTDESKKKMSDAKKGENNPNYGKHLSKETKIKLSEACKNVSEETKKKLSENKKGRHWYNNGKENIFCYECPPGCEPGMLKRK